MTEFLIYQAKTAVALAVFYMFYRLLLSRETFHRLNRIVLLGTAILSFILPLCVITVTKTVVVTAAPSAGADTAGAVLAGTAAVTPEWWHTVFAAVFAAGALAMLVSVAVSVVRIRKIIGSGEQHRLESGETMVITELDTQPFSWMKYIVLSREDSENAEIITHEKAHIAMGHSWDLLIADMITAMQWFNPAIWMLRSDLRALHEYEADDAVLRSGADIKKYQYLLIRKAVGKSGYSVANSFNHSTLKQRITMMLNKKSTKMSAWKALYIIPLAGISLAAGARTSVEYICDSPVRDVPVKVTGYADTLKIKDTQISIKTDTLKEILIKDTADITGKTQVYVVNTIDLDSLKSINPEQIKSISVYKNGAAADGVILVKIGDKGAAGSESDIVTVRSSRGDKNATDAVLYIIDGKRVDDISSVSPDNIVSVVVRKDPESLKAYKAEDKKGVIIVTTKKQEAAQ